MNAEFTVHQNTILNAATFGFLCAASPLDFVPNRRPEISFTSPDAGAMQSDTIHLAVHATDPDGDTTIYKVEYYITGTKSANPIVLPTHFTGTTLLAAY